MRPHAVNGGMDAHLPCRDEEGRVEEVEVGLAPVDPIVDQLQPVKAGMRPGKVDRHGALDLAALEGQRGDAGGVVRVVVCVCPRLRPNNRVLGNEKDNILGPDGPSL